MVSEQQPVDKAEPPGWQKLLAVVAPFLTTLALRLYLLPTTRTPFDSDEALFLLIARHILRGERPLFFYGENYGGTLDSYITAIFFGLFGDSIALARLVQAGLYLLGMLFTYLLARRLLPGSRFGPLAALWLLAVPPLLLTNWTHPAVRYAVVFTLGSLILYLGHRLLQEDANRLGVWLLFGAVCGLAFWTFGILATYMLPVFLLLLRNFKARRLPLVIAAAVMFFLFSVAWWLQLLDGLRVLYNPDNPAQLPPFLMRVFAFFALMLTAFFGIREPAGIQPVWPLLSALVLVFYMAAILYAIPYFRRKDPRSPATDSTGFAMLGLQVILWLIFFFATRFSLDATGRYITPLYPALAIAVGLALERLARQKRALGVGVLAALLAFNLAVHLNATWREPSGITAQMNPSLMFGNDYDQELIDFVAAQGGRGYSHHWISYKIAYLSDEQVILASFLPYSPNLTWSQRDHRYEPYAAVVTQADDRVFVIHHQPRLERYLEQALAEKNIAFLIKDIGPYRVYYDLSAIITPQEMGWTNSP
ncbi:MAG: hypothetical protein Kow0031_13570 [Anaerolineae bacterium]